MEEYKYFTYIFEDKKYTGYRLISEKSSFDIFSKIGYPGFEILTAPSSVYGKILYFKIYNKLIRKLKIKKLNDEIKLNSVEDKLFKLLERSTETDKKHDFGFSNYWGIYYNDNDNYDYFDSVEKYEKKVRTHSLIAQSKNNKQKIRQYENKSRFRK